MSKTFLFRAIPFSQTVLIQTIQFRMRALSGATIPGQSEQGSNGNKRVLCIPQNSIITGTSPWDCLASFQDTHWGVLPVCRVAVGVFYSPSRLGNETDRQSKRNQCYLQDLMIMMSFCKLYSSCLYGIVYE